MHLQAGNICFNTQEILQITWAYKYIMHENMMIYTQTGTQTYVYVKIQVHTQLQFFSAKTTSAKGIL